MNIKGTVGLAAVLAIGSLTAFAIDSSSKPIDGWVSDSKCGAMHAGSGGACVKKCIAGGEKPVFVDDAKKEVWAIDNPDAVKDHYGHHISMQGTEDAATKTVHITKVTMLADQGSKAASPMDSMEHK